MRGKLVSLLVAGWLAPIVAQAQGVTRPPVPPAPPQGAAPMQAPASLPKELQQPTVRRMPYDQWLKQYYQIYRIPKKPAILLGHGRLRPHSTINVVLEIVGEEGDDYLVGNPPPGDPPPASPIPGMRGKARVR